MNIYDQLQAVEDRYEELGELLSDPDVVSDTKRFMDLSKEEASTRDTVTTLPSTRTPSHMKPCHHLRPVGFGLGQQLSQTVVWEKKKAVR